MHLHLWRRWRPGVLCKSIKSSSKTSTPRPKNSASGLVGSYSTTRVPCSSTDFYWLALISTSTTSKTSYGRTRRDADQDKRNTYSKMSRGSRSHRTCHTEAGIVGGEGRLYLTASYPWSTRGRRSFRGSISRTRIQRTSRQRCVRIGRIWASEKIKLYSV